MSQSAQRPDYLRALSPAQYAAATQPVTGALSISAPPGSGKTRVLTSRVAWLVREQKIMPEELIVVTFTNKAAREMKTRLHKLIGEERTSRLSLGTFHALCAKFLRRNGKLIGLASNFSIMDAEDSRKVLKEIIKELAEHSQPGEDNLDLTIKPEVAQGSISWSKAKDISPQQYRANVSKNASDAKAWRSNLSESSSFKATMATIYENYTARLSAANALDFDDLLVFGVKLLKAHPHIVDHIRHVLVDEMQDTNTTQYQLMTLFASAKKHLTTVGDPDQSVYGWRAAELGNLQRMTKEFNTSSFILEENYRSTSSILDAALKVIEQDKDRPAKGLFTNHPTGPPVVLKQLPSPRSEASFMATEIKRLVAYSGGMLNYNDFVILLRYNALSREMEQALQAASIPSRMVGGSKFFERMEVKDVLAYLHLAVNPSYSPAFSRVINIPKRGIGEKSLQDFVARAAKMQRTPMDFAELVVNAQKGAKGKKTVADNSFGVKPAMIKGLTALVSAVQALRKEAIEGNSVESIIKYVLYTVKYESHLAKEQDFDARMENVKELINFAHNVVDGARAMPGTSPGHLEDSDAEAHSSDEVDEQSQLHSQSSQRKSALLSGVEDIAVKAEEEVLSPGSKKRKRGRPKKATPSESIVISDSSDEDLSAGTKRQKSKVAAKGSSPEGSADSPDDGENDLQATDVPETSPLRIFLEACTLSSDATEDSDASKEGPRVTLSTCHAAKGLEYPVVFVAGVEDGIFPFFRCEKKHEIDEERRLLYVAMTRAQGLLYLTRCEERMRRGETCTAELSQFLRSITGRPSTFGASSSAKKSEPPGKDNDNGKGKANGKGKDQSKDTSSSHLVRWGTERPEIDASVRDTLSIILDRSKVSEEQTQSMIDEFEETSTAAVIRQPDAGFGSHSSSGYGGWGGHGFGQAGMFRQMGAFRSDYGSARMGDRGFSTHAGEGERRGGGGFGDESGPIMGRTSNYAGFSSALKHFDKQGDSKDKKQSFVGPSAGNSYPKGKLGAGRSNSSGSRTILTPQGLSKDEGPDIYTNRGRGIDSASSETVQQPAAKVATSNRSSFYKNPALDDADGDGEEGKSKVGLETFTSDHKKTLDSLKSFGGGSSEFDGASASGNADPLAPMPPRAFGSGPKLGGRKGSKTLGMRRKV